MNTAVNFMDGKVAGPTAQINVQSDRRCQLAVNMKRALIQRSTDMIHWEDWQTMDLEDNNCEAVDVTTGESKCFYRAVEAPMTGTE